MTETISEILNQVHSVLIQKKYSANTIHCYSDWIYRFFFYSNMKNCQQIEKKDIINFLTFIKQNKDMAESSKKIAANAIKFLCKEILKIPFENSILIYSLEYKHKPVILEKNEIKRLLSTVLGEKRLVVCMMYGCGLSCSECLLLRVKDLDFRNKKIKIQNRNQFRYTLFPKSLHNPIINQLNKVEILFQENNNSDKYAGVLKLNGFSDDTEETTNEFKEHFLFPSRKLRCDLSTGQFIQYPISESLIHKTIRKMQRLSGMTKNFSSLSFRHSFAAHLIEDGYDIHLIQKLLGHRNVQSTMMYKNIAVQDAINIRSPLDDLFEAANP